MMLRRAIDKYIGLRKAEKRFAPRSAKQVRSVLVSLADVAGDIQIGELRRRHIERWFATRNMSASSLRTNYSAIRGFTSWCVDQRHLKNDPCRGIKGPRQPRSLPRALPGPDVSELLCACPDDRARVMVLLMVQEGLRCMEVAGLEVGDLEPLDWVMRIVGKGGHERFLPVSEQTRAAVSDYLSQYPATSGPLVRSYNTGNALTPGAISDVVNRVFRSAGIKRHRYDGRSAHALRHSAAAHMLDNGATIVHVQNVLGHASLSTTAIYLKRFYAAGELRSAMGGREY